MNSIEQLTFADHISVATSSGYCSPDDSTSNLSEYSSNSSVSSRSSRSSSISSIKSSISSKTKLLNKMLKKLIKNKKNGEEFYESEQEFECMTCARFDLTDSRVTKCHCLDWETESESFFFDEIGQQTDEKVNRVLCFVMYCSKRQDRNIPVNMYYRQFSCKYKQ